MKEAQIQAPSGPHATRIATLTAQIADADHQVLAAQARVETCRQEAIAATLRARDLEYCLGRIIQADDTDYRTAQAAAHAAAGRLALARRSLVAAESMRDSLSQQRTQAQAAAKAANLRAQVLASHPALAARLETAQQAVAAAKQDMSRDASSLRERAASRLKQVEDAVTEACRTARGSSAVPDIAIPQGGLRAMLAETDG